MRADPDSVDKDEVGEIVRRALAEDGAARDVTTLALVEEGVRAQARVIANNAVVVSGCDVACRVFAEVDDALTSAILIDDGMEACPGDALIRVEGSARSILSAERTALNFLQRMTGIAGLTRAFVNKVSSFGATVLDTRKTTPTLRVLEKYAVRCGGGENHRMGLSDRILIKDNHRALWMMGKLSFADAVREAKTRYPDLLVEIEVESADELVDALEAAPDWILLDNMPVDALKRCVELCGGRSKLEASGGITLQNVEAVAATGVDAISLGCLTHSAPAADLSLEIVTP